MSDNLTKSAKMISVVLAALSQNGVVRKNLSPESFNLREEEHSLFIDSMIWLQKEDLIHVTQQRGLVDFRGCSLSSKGYALLGYEIEIENEKVSINTAIEKVQDQGIDAGKAGSFLGSFAGGFIKSLG